MRFVRLCAVVCVFSCVISATPALRADCYSSLSPCYGSGLGADSLANTVVGGQYNAIVSYRFLAEHSGSLSSILVYLIPDHPGYAAGTGGTIQVTVNTDDGTAAHNPSSTVLASYLITNALTLTPSRYFPLLTFAVAPTLVAGQLYHIVFTNVDASPATNYLSVDGLYQANPGATTQPTMSDVDCAVLLNQAGLPWTERVGFTPSMQLNYSDGWSGGIGYMEVWSGVPESASGSSAVREVFTVSGSSKTVTNVSIRVNRVSGGDPLVVRLESADGTLIEEGSIPAASILTGGSYGWATYAFSSAHTLASGQAYHLDFEATSTSAYQLFPIRKGSAYGFASTTYFSDGYAEFKQSGGSWSGWTQWGVTNRTDSDLQFYFMLSGATSQSLTLAGPTVSNATAATSTSAAISWTTDQPSTSQVQYGTSTSYSASTPINSGLATSHSVTVTGLTSGTVYHYRVLSTNASGIQTVSGDLTFTTP